MKVACPVLILLTLLLPLFLYAQPQSSPSSVRMEAYTQRKKLQEQSLISNLEFKNIGPTIFSGRVTDIDANPKDPSHFYVAYASGGLWYTDNNGASFTPLFDHEAAMTIGDIAVDWNHNIIWIGTGENNSSRSSYSGLGMYRSNNGGKSWEHRGLPESHHIGRILLDDQDTNTVVVAVLGSLYSANPERGMYKTTDAGTTWKKTLFVNENAGGIDLVRSPSQHNVLFAATWERTRRAWNLSESGAGSGIYRSENNGDSWQLLTTDRSGFPTGDNVGRIGLDIAQSPEGPILYAILDNYNRRPAEKVDEDVVTKDMLRTMDATTFLNLTEEKLQTFLEDNRFPDKYTADTIFTLVRDQKISPLTLVEYLDDANSLLFDTDVIGAEVYSSTDEGRSWKKTHAKYLDLVYNTYGYYFGQIRVSPFDSKKLYILGVPILMSGDGGATWKSIDGDNVHGDHHALWLSPVRDKHLILGNDGGINISYDDGLNYFKCNSPAVGQFYSVHTDRTDPYHVYGGLQDNGVWGGSHLYSFSTDWHNSGDYPYDFLYGGDGMQVQVDFRNNNTVYTGLQFGNYARVDKNSGRSKYITPRHDLMERPFRWNWQAPILLSRHQQDIFYMGSNYLHRSLDGGESFDVISPDLTKGGKQGDVPYGTLTTIHESPLEIGLIYTGSDDGLIYLTPDFGKTWKRLSDALPPDLWVSRVKASAHKKSRAYASLNGYRWDNFTAYLYASDDFGATWTRIGLDLPAEPINVVIEDPVNEDILFVGTDHGLYVSFDRGKQFMGAGNSLPSVAVHDLDIQPIEHHLLVGTHGRSFYLADLAQLELMDSSLLADKLHLFAIPESGMRSSERWGTRSADWIEYYNPEIEIPLYSNTTRRIMLQVLHGDVLVYNREVEVDRGLNFIEYDLSVDKDKVNKFYKSYAVVEPKATLKASESGVQYLQKGAYKVIIAADGIESSRPFELK